MSGTEKTAFFCRARAFVSGAILCGLCACAMFSCASIEKMLSGLAAPYAVFDSRIVERAGPEIECTFSNVGEKTIVRVKLFARVQEASDSVDVSEDFSEAEFVLDAEFNPGDSERIFIPLPEFEFEGGIENYSVEMIFASEIIFSDGEVWNDRNGMSVL